ncbi:MAG: DUF3134 domain-containing protein [Leptolyngbya sp. LCM1.Bin17]|nr:MAG: DUF3134 domain-containing protein [Leptolyngbya sp. LCM1.Bin17]
MASEHYNPSLRQVPRSAKAPILPSSGESSILAWLEDIGRLRSREPQESLFDEAENEEISDLMGNDDNFEEEEDNDMAIEDD